MASSLFSIASFLKFLPFLNFLFASYLTESFQSLLEALPPLPSLQLDAPGSALTLSSHPPRDLAQPLGSNRHLNADASQILISRSD